MPFVKDTSYRDMPFSSESPSPDDFHCFASVRQLIDQMKHQRNMYRCRTVGVVSCDYGKFVIHELDDSNVRICLSLTDSLVMPPFTAKPYPAQVFGFIHWEDGVGPVIQPYVLQSISVACALSLREAMIWTSRYHVANRGVFNKREE